MSDSGTTRADGPMRCPSCGNRLIEVERSDILIDACTSCRGVWLDRGELDKILVKERQMLAGDPDEDFLLEVEGRQGDPRVHRDDDSYSRGRQQDSDSGHGGKRRRRGLLDELLDFG